MCMYFRSMFPFYTVWTHLHILGFTSAVLGVLSYCEYMYVYMYVCMCICMYVHVLLLHVPLLYSMDKPAHFGLHKRCLLGVISYCEYMYVYMYLCICVCMCVCTHTRKCLIITLQKALSYCEYLCVFTYTYITHIHIHTVVAARTVPGFISTDITMYVCMYVYTHTCAHTHAHIHTVVASRTEPGFISSDITEEESRVIQVSKMYVCMYVCMYMV
jgi:hypothetical protein